jgi:hypothetical protein
VAVDGIGPHDIPMEEEIQECAVQGRIMFALSWDEKGV